MPINTRAFWLGYVLNRVNTHTQQSALLIIPKSYSSSTFILLIALLVATHGAAKSVSVDNDDARIQYSPVGWDRDFDLDKTKVFDGTLHTGTANNTDVFFAFTFKGTSIEIRYVRSTTPGTVLNPRYSIDGSQVPANTRRDLVSRVPTLVDHWAYNQTLFRVTGLTNTEHKLEVHVLQHDQLFFDYLIYEGEDAGSVVPSESIRNTGSGTNPSSTFSTSASSVNGSGSTFSTSGVNGPGTFSTSGVNGPGFSTSASGVTASGSTFPTSASDVNGPGGTVSASVSVVPGPGGFKIGPVIGGVVSGVVFVILIVVLYYFLKRQRDAGLHLVVTPYEGEEFSRGRIPPVRNATRPPKSDTPSPGTNRVPGTLADESVEVGRMSGATNIEP